MPFHALQAEWDADVLGRDPLAWSGYEPPEVDSVLTGRTEHYALIEGRFDVMGGSMGAAHGERVVRAYERAIVAGLPVVVITASGGARLQEGMVALVQMARTAGAARRHRQAGLLSVAVLRSPTTGGVLASYASLADVRAAVAGATIGFAGPRVVEQTLGLRLTASSHTAEAAYEAGLIDALLQPGEEPAWIEAALGLRDRPPVEAAAQPPVPTAPVKEDYPTAEGAWGEVLRARDPSRPDPYAWAVLLCSSWVELRGADPVVHAGLARCGGRRMVVIAFGRGRPRPAGYRLARRAMALAGRLGLPLLTLIDTAGADPSSESESEGIAGEIARTLAAMDQLSTVSVAVCTGEGGSGGAMALAHADRLLILEHAVFSVISPEGAAAILERDTARAHDVAERLGLTSADLLRLGVVDAVVAEEPAAVCTAVARAFDDAVPGDRRARADTITARWTQ